MIRSNTNGTYNSAINRPFPDRNGNTHKTGGGVNNYLEKNPTTQLNKKTELKQKHDNNDNTYLSIEVIKKILIKIIFEKKLSTEQLAAELQISTRNLISIMKGKNESLIAKINLPLIKLYCGINFYKFKGCLTNNLNRAPTRLR